MTEVQVLDLHATPMSTLQSQNAWLAMTTDNYS